ncbi:MAG: hypothetical protein QM783_07360 [Phycisphaerales bacterium]
MIRAELRDGARVWLNWLLMTNDYSSSPETRIGDPLDVLARIARRRMPPARHAPMKLLGVEREIASKWLMELRFPANMYIAEVQTSVPRPGRNDGPAWLHVVWYGDDTDDVSGAVAIALGSLSISDFSAAI